MTQPNFSFANSSPQSIDGTRCDCTATRTPARSEETGIACDLTVFTTAERAEHLARTQAVVAAVRSLTEEHDAFVLAFAAAPSRRAEIERWAEAERRCCPFFAFELRDADDGHTLLLRVSGPVAGKEILRAAMQSYGVASGEERAP